MKTEEASKELKRLGALAVFGELIDAKISHYYKLIGSAKDKDETWDLRTAIKVLTGLKAETLSNSAKKDEQQVLEEV